MTTRLTRPIALIAPLRIPRQHHTSAPLYAKLLDPSNKSIFPAYATSPAPSAPYPDSPNLYKPTQIGIASRRPPAPLSSPSAIAAEHERELDAFLLRALRSTSIAQGGALDLPSLARELEAKTGAVLPVSLKYESTPEEGRKVHVEPSRREASVSGMKEEQQDGVVTIAFVTGGEKPSFVLHSGFAVGQSEKGVGATILTCCHSLLSASAKLTASLKPSSSTLPPSAAFIITSSGHTFPVVSIQSALPSADLVLLSLAPEPLRDPAYALRNTGKKAVSPEDREPTVPPLKSLPVSPYPAVVGTRIASLAYRSPMSQDKPRDWVHGRIIEYTDSIGRAAETGTYDDLAQMAFTTLPSAGSSGGPIIDVDTGAVIGVVRGHHHRHGDKGAQGFGTPSEKIFELFTLPGFEGKTARTPETVEKEGKQARSSSK